MKTENETKEHHKLDETDELILSLLRNSLTQGINELKKRGLRGVNIEIELTRHIKNELKD